MSQSLFYLPLPRVVLFGRAAVDPRSVPQSVSCVAPYHPGRRDFPGPVGSEGLSSCRLPKTRDGLSDGAHAPPAVGLLHGSSVPRPMAVPGLCVPAPVRDRTAFAQGSFAPEALPPFLAPMSPCADPVASRPHFRLCPYRGRPCRLRHPQLVSGTVPILLCLPVLECCAHNAGGSPGCT